MAKRFRLPSGIEVTRASNGRGRGFRFELHVLAHPVVPAKLTEADVAELARHLAICAGCGEFKLDGSTCPVTNLAH